MNRKLSSEETRVVRRAAFLHKNTSPGGLGTISKTHPTTLSIGASTMARTGVTPNVLEQLQDIAITDKAISIVIPTYNERDNIIPVVERIDKALHDYDYEIVFVDDSSADGTAELAAALSHEYPVKVIVRNGTEKGLASAVVHGLKYVTGQIVAVMDADLQHPPEAIPKLLSEIGKGNDIVIASRYTEGGACRNWGLVRRIISKGALILTHILLPSTRGINDPLSGFFMFNKQVVANARLRPTGYKILLEILMEGECRATAEIPYIFETRGSGESKLNIRQQVHFLKHTYSLMKRKGELNRFVKFCLVGFSGVIVNMSLLYALTEFFGLFYVISAAISIETSIVSNFILNNFFTFSDRRLPSIRSFMNRLLKFTTVSLAGLAVNMGMLWTLTEIFGIYYLISQLFGIMTATLWNYLANTYWTWRYQPDSRIAEGDMPA